MKLENKIGGLVEIDWANDLHELQPENIKVPINIEYLKQSLLKYGFALPFAVWNDNGKYFCIDGHTRKEILNELIADGVDVPVKLKGFEVLAKDRQEAIKILVEVYNQKHNPFAEEILTEWLEVESIKVEDIKWKSINIKKQLVDEENDEIPEEITITPTFKIEVICKTQKEQNKTFLKLIEEGYEVNLL